jgi:hypothetical protein
MEEAKPYEVVVKGRDLVIGYACPRCKIFHGATIYACKWDEAVKASYEAAERCCNRRCEDCGKRIDEKIYYTVCVECRPAREAAREQARFDKAKKIPESDYDGWIFYRGDYYADLDALEDHCEQNALEWPEYVWSCRKLEFEINAESVIASALEEHHEDAGERISREQETELQTFLDAWCAKQGVSSWEEDDSCAVVLEPRLTEVDE